MLEGVNIATKLSEPTPHTVEGEVEVELGWFRVKENENNRKRTLFHSLLL